MAEARRVIETLEPLVTPQRARRLRQVLAARSEQVAFVFERMIDPHNFSAALRTLDAFSFQSVHQVHPGERLGFSRGITIGAERWLTLETAADTESCFAELRSRGYRILASDLRAETPVELADIDFAAPTALVFGNEHLGVSEEVRRLADGSFRIAMHGFSQSFNLSVSVALCAFRARQELDRLAGQGDPPGNFALSEARRLALHAQWLKQSVRNADAILAGETPPPRPGGGG